METSELGDNFYDKIKSRLYGRVGRELRLAHRVLDLGCGDCELAQYLSKTYGHKITGIDISSASFPDNRKTKKDGQLVHCIRKDAAGLDFIQNETIDAVVMFWSLHEMNNPQAVLEEAYRVLRVAGRILVVEFPCNSLAQKLWNENYYTSGKLINILHKAGFKDIQAKLIEHKQILWANGYCGAKNSRKSERIKVEAYEK